LLVDGLSSAGLIDGTILDIGAGVGSLAFEALDRGCRRAVIVEASAGYLAAATDEARRRDRTSIVEFSRGDFVDVSPAIPRATLVTLDRVVCCYPAYEPLLGEALRHAECAFALSYPKDRWYVRAAMGLENGVRWWRNKRFRTFVHAEEGMHAVIEAGGFKLVSRSGTFIWSVDVYRRSDR
jgi:magnesium-protoporphyrin O-methyltransferase